MSVKMGCYTAVINNTKTLKLYFSCVRQTWGRSPRTWYVHYSHSGKWRLYHLGLKELSTISGTRHLLLAKVHHMAIHNFKGNREM